MAFHPWWPFHSVHPHLVFEVLAYSVGFHLVRRRSQAGTDPLPAQARVWLLVAAVAGAATGAKVLFWLEDPAATWAHRADPSWLFSGRTIVGGLLGGWGGVELAKRAAGIARSTGDLLVTPLIAGIAIGRIGCFLSGVTDGTHGLPTDLPVGMDLGDGIPRHPTALYEIGALLALGAALRTRALPLPGDRFLVFLAGYLTFRLLVEPLKTQPALFLGLSAIQLACVAGVLAIGAVAWRRHRAP